MSTPAATPASATTNLNGTKTKEDSSPQTPIRNVFANYSQLVSRVHLSRHFTPPSWTIEVNFVSLGLFILALATRLYKLDFPKAIVFDELHYGKFAAFYMKQMFFYDSHPPLGKQLIALGAYLGGYDGETVFDRIGADYGPNVPVWSLRAVPALFGSLIVPTMYHLILELGFTHQTASLAALFVILDNALLTQSRLILMESMLIFFSLFGLLALLKFTKLRESNFSARWWGWLLTGGGSLACGLSVKYVGVLSLLLGATLVTLDFWKMLPDHTRTTSQLLKELGARVTGLIVWPIVLYLLIFYVHLAILIRAGPHDNVMTSAFQASLEGGLAAITKGQPSEVAHGSQVTLRNTHGPRVCWLHSHPHPYPVLYPDGRGSSHQQQVTCYSFKDVNNWWLVKRPEKNNLVVGPKPDSIQHGDVIQLVHGITSRALNSHNVAAPMSPHSQEVSCYIDYNLGTPAQNLWQVDITNREQAGDTWHTIHSHVRLIHVNSSHALQLTGQQLPEWGFNQYEVVTHRTVEQPQTVWNVEEHQYTKTEDPKERERRMGSSEFVPTAPTSLTFWDKLQELQLKMLDISIDNVEDHLYSSDPLEWPVLTRGIAYWISPKSNAQIHLLGNIILWYSAAGALLLYSVLLAFYLLRRQRACYDLSEDEWTKFWRSGLLGLGGYLLHFVPYLLNDRTLFLHHYLPAFVWSLVVLAIMVEHLDLLLGLLPQAQYVNLVRQAYHALVLVWLVAIAYVFSRFACLSYGSFPLSKNEVLALRWKETWDLIVHQA